MKSPPEPTPLEEIVAAVLADDRASLSAAMCHHFGNQLLAITFEATRIRDHAPEDPEAREALAGLERGLARIKDSLARYRALAQINDGPVRATEVDELVREVAEERRTRRAPSPDRPELALTAPTPIAVPPLAVRLALAELIDNALDANDGDEPIRIATEQTPDGTAIRVENAWSGDDPSIVGRAGRPGFSLKPGHTAIGLALTSRAMAQSCGDLRLDAENGRWTATLTFRAHPVPATGASPSERPVVLFVETSGETPSMVAGRLRDSGFDCAHELRPPPDMPRPVAIVLGALRGPHDGGTEAAILRERFPDVPIVSLGQHASPKHGVVAQYDCDAVVAAVNAAIGSRS